MYVPSREVRSRKHVNKRKVDRDFIIAGLDKRGEEVEETHRLRYLIITIHFDDKEGRMT